MKVQNSKLSTGLILCTVNTFLLSHKMFCGFKILVPSAGTTIENSMNNPIKCIFKNVPFFKYFGITDTFKPIWQ